MQLHGLVKAKLLMTEKDNSVLNVQASLSLDHGLWAWIQGWILALGRTRYQSTPLEPLWQPRCFPVGSSGGYGQAATSAAITGAFASWAAWSWSC